mgnify:CR=1 FL=1
MDIHLVNRYNNSHTNYNVKENISMQNPVITIEMMNGDIIKAELYPEVAPNTVNNFL